MKAASWQMLTISTALAFSGCANERVETSKCIYSASEIAQLEASGRLKNREALRELDLCYGFDNRTKDQERIHAARIALKDPEALDKDAMKLLIETESESDKSVKRQKLRKALELAIESARSEGRTDVDNDLTVDAIKREIGQLD